MMSKQTITALVVGALAAACASSPKVEPIQAVAPKPKVKTASDYAEDAAAALASDDYAAAVKAYDEVLERDPDNAAVHYNRAYALHQAGDLDAAQQAYAEVLRLEPENVDAALNLGAILKEQGEVDRAVEVTRAALEQNEFNGPLLNNLSVLHRVAGRYDDAVAAVRKLLMRDKSNIDAYKNLSLIYYDQERYRLSQTILENALKMAKEQGEEDADIYVNLGMIYLARSENAKAMGAFKRAKSIDADHPVANYNIASLALAHRDYGLAADSYDTVAKSWSDNYDVVVGKGFALQGQGKLDGAAQELERARTLLAKLPEERPGEEDQIIYQLMVIHQNAEQPEKALSYADEYMKAKGLSCGPEDYDGFCARYNGIKLMIEMAAESAAPPEEEVKQAVDAADSTIFTEGDEPAPGEEGGDAALGDGTEDAATEATPEDATEGVDDASAEEAPADATSDPST